ncbi:MAG: LacI family transcriptional regulator [Acidimicrobiia bacterium]|nr:LacI family transcriptional regulator [Acidimicrobiia bacterium]
MATILDVAAKAGVGVGTVSRVLNNSPHVSGPTRAKVTAAIAELNYRPSAVARALSSGKTSALPVFATNITLPSVTARIRGILDLVDEVHELVVCQVREPEQRFEFVDRHAVRQPAFGVITIGVDLEPGEVASFASSEVPVVSLDYQLDGVPSIVIDDVAAGEAATKHLLGLGHTRIAFLGDAETGDYRSRASEERRSGYRAAMQDAGIEPIPTYDARVVDGKKDAAGEVLLQATPPTAIIADADSTALCVLAVARRMSLGVPNDLSVIGFDDIWAADAAGLTTIAQPLEESGRLSAQLLFSLARGEDVAMVTRLETNLVERETTAPPS